MGQGRAFRMVQRVAISPPGSQSPLHAEAQGSSAFPGSAPWALGQKESVPARAREIERARVCV